MSSDLMKWTHNLRMLSINTAAILTWQVLLNSGDMERKGNLCFIIVLPFTIEGLPIYNPGLMRHCLWQCNLIPHLPYPCSCGPRGQQGVSVDEISQQAGQSNHIARYVTDTAIGFIPSPNQHLPFSNWAWYHSVTKSYTNQHIPFSMWRMLPLSHWLWY